MDVTNDDITHLIDLHFNDRYALYKLQYDSFHQFIDETVFRELKENTNVFYERADKDKIYKYRFVYENIILKPPTLENEDNYMWPEDARKKHLTYSSKLSATVKQIQ